MLAVVDEQTQGHDTIPETTWLCHMHSSVPTSSVGKLVVQVEVVDCYCVDNALARLGDPLFVVRPPRFVHAPFARELSFVCATTQTDANIRPPLEKNTPCFSD